MTHFAYRLARRMDPILQLGAPEPVERYAAPRFQVVGQRFNVRHVAWKRAADIAISLTALILVSPLMLLAAIAVKMSSPGPVFFAQERIGLDRRCRNRRSNPSNGAQDRRRKDRRVLINFGRPFMIYKFRTMVVDAEAPGKPMWAKERDPRITTVGWFLRKTRIDELPQFVNVLRGEMSIVGPRPERAYFIGQIEKDLPEFQLRLRTKPGITGLAQVELGYTNTDEGLRRKLDFDLEYIRRLTPWTDLKILFKTVFVVLTGKGAC